MTTPENISEVLDQIAQLLEFEGFEYEYNFYERKLIIKENPVTNPFIPELYQSMKVNN